MIEIVPGARTEEGEHKEENTGRFQMIQSCVKREKQKELSQKAYLLLNKTAHLIRKSN